MAVRIVRAGDQYSFYFSTDGVTWDYFVSLNTATEFSKVGVMAKSWGANSITAQYSYFSVFNQSAHDVVSLLLAGPLAWPAAIWKTPATNGTGIIFHCWPGPGTARLVFAAGIVSA